MVLPKGASDLGAEAKEIAEKVSRPVRDRVENIKDQVATQEGLKNIAFTATGRDPAIGIATGIALGISALGIGLGVKGLKSAFRGVRRLFGTPQEPEPEESIRDNQQDVMASVEKLDELTRQSIVTKEETMNFREEAVSLLQQILDANKKIAEINEGMLTNAARERLEKFRADTERLENEIEARRLQEDMLDALEEIKAANQNVRSEGEERGGSLVRDFLTAQGILGIIKSLPKLILGAVTTLIPRFIGALFAGIGKAVILGLKAFSFATFFVGIGVSLAEGIGDAIQTVMDGGSILEAIGNFVTGTLGMLASFFTGGLLDKDKIQESLNEIFPAVGNLIKDTFLFLTESLMDIGAFLVPKIANFASEKWDDFWDAFFDIKDFLMDKAKETFANIIDSIRMAVIGIVQKIPGIGDNIARSLMTPEEQKQFDRRRKVQEISERLRDIRAEQAETAGRENSLFFSDNRRARELRELEREEAAAVAELRELKLPTIQRPQRQETALAAIKAESQAASQRGLSPIVTVAPSTAVNAPTQNVNNTFALPLNANNGEGTIDRAFNSEF